jgi:hypothetical protein
MQISGAASRFKALLFPVGQRSRMVRFGLYRGITLNLDLGYQTQHYLGLWERETYAAIRSIAGKVDWAIDVGAGRGELCLYLMLNGCRDIYAFEPNPREAAQMRANIALNGLLRNESPHLIEKFAGVARDAVRLDDLPVNRAGRGFLKIDVDGAELDVLDGARSLLREARPAILLEVHSPDLEKQSIALLEGCAYRVKIIDNAWWRMFVPEQRPLEHNRWLFAT